MNIPTTAQYYQIAFTLGWSALLSWCTEPLKTWLEDIGKAPIEAEASDAQNKHRDLKAEHQERLDFMNWISDPVIRRIQEKIYLLHSIHIGNNSNGENFVWNLDSLEWEQMRLYTQWSKGYSYPRSVMIKRSAVDETPQSTLIINILAPETVKVYEEVWSEVDNVRQIASYQWDRWTPDLPVIEERALLIKSLDWAKASIQKATTNESEKLKEEKVKNSRNLARILAPYQPKIEPN